MKKVNTLSEYQEGAKKTAIYKQRILYPSTGLVEEAGEVAGKIKKIIRDADGKPNDEQRKGVALEEGDVMWYFVNLLSDIKIDVNKVIEWIALKTFRDKVSNLRVVETPILAIRLCKIASSVSEESIENYYYEGEPQNGTEEFIVSSISEGIAIIDIIARRHGYTLSDVCNMNLEKLDDRVKRDKIHGSGDER